MVDTNNRESRQYNIADNEDMNINYWINDHKIWAQGYRI